MQVSLGNLISSENPSHSEPILTTLRTSSPEMRPHKLEHFLRALMAEFLELDDMEEISDVDNFVELGADSMQAVDFKTELEKHLHCALRSTLLFDQPSFSALSTYLLNEVLDFPPASQTEKQSEIIQSTNAKQGEIAIIAMGGLFPGANTIQQFWSNLLQGQSLELDKTSLDYGKLSDDINNNQNKHFSTDKLNSRALRLFTEVMNQALTEAAIHPEQFAKKTTAVFVAAHQDALDIPLANQISFHLNLRGPSETFNTLCTSAYTSLHKAIQSLRAGDCEQAIVGAVNLIDAHKFQQNASQDLYRQLLSPDNQTHSFDSLAQGYVRSEGVGVLLLKPLKNALEDQNTILALIRSSASFHGGRGYSYEAPNPQAMKQAINQCLNQDPIQPESIGYIEAHGIGNAIADALELGAIEQAYRSASSQNHQWPVTCIKPAIGHPELASGFACIIKAIKAMQTGTIPGIANLTNINPELSANQSLVLLQSNIAWPTSKPPKRVALNSFAVGGLSAHLILEEYLPGKVQSSVIMENYPRMETFLPQSITNLKLSPSDQGLISRLFLEVFELDFAKLDYEQSLVDYGFDSIKVIQFITLLNEQLGLNIKISQVLGVDNLSAFIELFCRERRASQNTGIEVELATSSTETREEFPLSEVQKGLWYVQALNPQSVGFNIPISFKSAHQIDRSALATAFHKILQHYPILRAYYRQKDQNEQVLQGIRANSTDFIPKFLVLEPEQELSELQQRLLHKVFDLAQDPLIRLYVIEGGDSATTVYFVLHHIIFDGTSGAIFINEFWDLYHRLRTGQYIAPKPAELAFADFVAWEQDYLSHAEGEQDKSWWQNLLQDYSEPVNLPYDFLDRKPASYLEIGCIKKTLNHPAVKAWKELAAHLKINMSVLLLSAFQIFLHKLTQQEEITLTVPVRGRPKSAFEKSIGCYINVMVMPCSIQTRESFNDLAQANRKQFLECLDHSQYPFPRLMSDLGLSLKSQQDNPFPVSFTYQNFFDDLLNNQEFLKDIQASYDIFQQTDDNYTLEIYDFRDSLQLNFKFKRSLFEPDNIERHAAYFLNLLTQISTDPTQAIERYALTTYNEMRQFDQLFNTNASGASTSLCIHELFAQQAASSPDQIAVIYEDQRLTYQQLDEQSTQLALYLQQQGVKPDSIVALCIKRSLDMIVAVLGILKAGGAYLPLDSTHPDERLQQLLLDSDAKWLISNNGQSSRLRLLAQGLRRQFISLDSDWEEIKRAEGRLRTEVCPSNLAYVIYTSGSTGQPKGVMVEHRNVVNHNLFAIQAYQLLPQDKVLQFSTISFDIFVEEVFPTLLSGASLVLMDGQRFTDVNYLKELINRQQISLLNLPTAYWHGLADQSFTPGSLKRVIIGGEKAEIEKFRQWQTLNPYIQVINTYGPTETTVISLYYPLPNNLDSDQAIPLGKAIANTQVYILDKQLHLVPPGIPGELHIAGAGVSRGYLKRPDLTDERFIANPFGTGKLYKTGDLVKWLPNGRLEFMGRTDEQIKIRGFRVEVSEVERILNQLPDLQAAVVVAQNAPVGKRLAAFYVAKHPVEESKLRSDLGALLPDYMIPGAWKALEALPLTANGKINRKALQNLKLEFEHRKSYQAPLNETESKLVEIWQEVLGLPRIGTQDEFFALGGHSLLAIQIVLRINKIFGIELSLSQFFEAETIGGLVQRIGASSLADNQHSLSRYVEESEEIIL